MNKITIFLILATVVYSASAQTSKRNIHIRTIGRDTVSMPLDSAYFLIEDDCSEINRYTRFDFHSGKFYGKFKDVSKANPKLTVAEGEYTTDGLKTGLFTTHYLNGNLQATGIFKDDKYDGRWEMFYRNGKPEITFEVVNGELRIINAWTADGLKTVDNGTGDYTAKLDAVYWKGKLLNGRPEGKWKLYNTDDASNTPAAEEHYKKGVFRDGSIGNDNLIYTDISHLKLVDAARLSLVHLEHMYVSQIPCGGPKLPHIVNAQYKGGLDAFSKRIGDEVAPYMSKDDLAGINNTIEIDGEVSEKGQLEKLENAGLFGDQLAKRIIARLYHLPALIPATSDGKPVRQKFKISFQIYNFVYRLAYQFLPIDAN